MDDITEPLQEVQPQTTSTITTMVEKIDEYLPANVSLKSYVDALAGTTKDKFLEDLSLLKVTPATVTLLVATIATLFVAGLLLGGRGGLLASSKLKKKKTKKPTKAQKSNREIQQILDFVEETYVPQIDDYIENYGELSEEDQQYKFKYFEEMLLKELMKLDGIDVIGNEVLRENRRKVIRFVQDHQKRLDLFRKENL